MGFWRIVVEFLNISNRFFYLFFFGTREFIFSIKILLRCHFRSLLSKVWIGGQMKVKHKNQLFWTYGFRDIDLWFFSIVHHFFCLTNLYVFWPFRSDPPKVKLGPSPKNTFLENPDHVFEDIILNSSFFMFESCISTYI